jgi:hypothetical protein
VGQDIQDQLVGHVKAEQAVRKRKRLQSRFRKVYTGMPLFPFRQGHEGYIRAKAGQGGLPDTGDAIFLGVFPQIGKCTPAGKVAVKGDESQDLNRRHMNRIFFIS